MALKHFARIRELSKVEKPVVDERLRNSTKPDWNQHTIKV